MTAAIPIVTVDSIVAAVCRLGASVAGVLPMETLLKTPSQAGRRHPYWPKWAGSVLVFGLDHPPDILPLDDWGGKYGTLGNRRLIGIGDRVTEWLVTNRGIRAHNLPYPPHAGGIFLKEAAAAAGLGIIGRNNLLVSPGFGAHLRFRALLLDAAFNTTSGPAGFDPCHGCDAPCRRSCPQDAFGDGHFCVDRCRRQMQRDQACRQPETNPGIGAAGLYQLRFCRNCELYCPVGEKHPRADSQSSG